MITAHSLNARRDLSRFYGEVLRQLQQSLRELGRQPRGSGIKKLQGTDDLYRKRSGNYRIQYEINDMRREIIVHRIGDRKDAY